MKQTRLILVICSIIIGIIPEIYGQITETLYYNKDWKGVGTIEEAEYYRIVTFNSKGKPTGEILDYYKTGEIQSRIESAKSINKFDDSKSIFVGKSSIYYRNGNKSLKASRNSEGLIVGDLTYYYESGKIMAKETYNSKGKIIGKVKRYDENGKLFIKKADKHKITDNQHTENKKNEKIIYNLTLTMEGKLRDKGDVVGDIITNIPTETNVDVYSKDKGYYKVNYKGKIGYLNELYFNENNKYQKKISSNPKKSNTKKIKSFYKDGKSFQYYIHNGVSVTMHLSIEKKYGKYYIAYVAIENLTGKSFNFNPNNIRAIFTKKDKSFLGEVLSSNEYIRKVNNRQAWNSALVAFGELNEASKVGYSSSSTLSTTSSYSNSYGSASGYYGNTYGSISGSSSSYGTATTRSNTQSYNAEANYAAQQNAKKNVRNYQNQQYKIKKVLNQGYLKLNTIYNEQRIVGQINIKYKRANEISITIPVNGVNYDFLWNNN